MANLKANCGICGESGATMQFNLMTLKTKYSGTYVYRVMERFVESDLSGFAVNLTDSGACNDCYAKLNEYDAAYTKAIIVQKELMDLLQNSPLGIVTDLETMETVDNDGELDQNDGQLQSQKEEEHFEESNESVTPKEKSYAEPENSLLNSEICWKCNTCGKQFSNLSEMQMHKHDTIKLENSEEDWLTSNLLIDPASSQHHEILDESIDLEEGSVGVDCTTPTDSLGEEYIVEGLDDELNEIETLEPLVKAKRTYECYYCDEYFSNKESFKDHVENMHQTAKGNHKCKTCGFLAKTRAALCNHFGKHSRPSVKCNICNKVFQQKGTLQRHMVIHTRETSYFCNVCGKGYIHYSSYYMHMLAHKNIRANKCKICDYKLRSASHLKRHMRTHSGEKPFACPECGQKFSQRYNMITHLNGHRGITRKSAKTFICRMCQNSYERKMLLKQHLQVEHGISDEYEIDSAMLVKNLSSISK